MKKIVVTGGTGFLGRAVVAELRRREHQVVSISRGEGVDLRSPIQTAAFLRAASPDLVVHCAAHVGGIAYVQKHGSEVYRDNLHIGMGLLEGMTQSGVRSLVHVMPNCTYPAAKGVYREDEWWDGPMHETVLMYGLPRKAVWGLCWTLGQSGQLASGHLILPNLYGPGDHLDPVRGHALGAIIARVLEAQRKDCRRVTLWGTGRVIREWLYVDDAARAIAAYVDVFADRQSVADNSAVYNVGMGEGVSVAELAERIKRAARWDGQFEFDPSRPDGAERKVLDGSRFHRLTGWRAMVPLDEGIGHAVEYYRGALCGV